MFKRLTFMGSLALALATVPCHGQELDTASRWATGDSLGQLLKGQGGPTLGAALATIFLTAHPNELPFVALVRMAKVKLQDPSLYLDVRYELTEIRAQHQLRLSEFSADPGYVLHSCCARELHGLGSAQILLLARQRVQESFAEAETILRATEELIRGRLFDGPGSDVILFESIRVGDVRILWMEDVHRGVHPRLHLTIRNGSKGPLAGFAADARVESGSGDGAVARSRFAFTFQEDLRPGQEQVLRLLPSAEFRWQIEAADSLRSAPLTITITKLSFPDGTERIAYYKDPAWVARLETQLKAVAVVRQVVDKMHEALVMKMATGPGTGRPVVSLAAAY